MSRTFHFYTEHKHAQCFLEMLVLYSVLRTRALVGLGDRTGHLIGQLNKCGYNLNRAE